MSETLAELLDAVRGNGRAHAEEWPGHTVQETDNSTPAERAIVLTCDVCDWTEAAGGSHSAAPV